MPNDKPPLNFFDTDSFDDLVSGPEGRKNVEAYMDSLLDQLKTKITSSLTVGENVLAPTLPMNMDALEPAPRKHGVPIWEGKAEPAPVQPTPTPSFVPRSEPVSPAFVQPTVYKSEIPVEKGTVVTGNAPAKTTEDFLSRPLSTQPSESEDEKKEKPKTKKVNADAIEKRYKDREEKLGDLFKNRGQIS